MRSCFTSCDTIVLPKETNPESQPHSGATITNGERTDESTRYLSIDTRCAAWRPSLRNLPMASGVAERPARRRRRGLRGLRRGSVPLRPGPTPVRFVLARRTTIWPVRPSNVFAGLSCSQLGHGPVNIRNRSIVSNDLRPDFFLKKKPKT